MTKQEKINWLENAISEELINAFASAVQSLNSRSFEDRVEANEDYFLIKEELLKRMAK